MSRLGVPAFVWLGLLTAPLWLDGWRLSQLSQFLPYGILAMSLALIWGHGGLLCFGQAVFFGLGAYAMSLETLGMIPGLAPWPATPLGLVLALAVPALVANLIGRFLFFGEGLKGAYFGIVTLAFAVIVERLATNWDYAGGLNGLMNVPPVTLGLVGEGTEIWDDIPVYLIALGTAFLVYLGLSWLLSAPWGLALRAVRDEERRTAALGFDTARIKLQAFTLSAAVAGLAGALFVTQFGFASPPLIGFALSTEVLVWVALGGRENLLAAFLGALAVKLLEGQLGEWLGAAWPLALGLLLLVSVVLLPRGALASLIAWRWRRRPSGPKDVIREG